MPLKTIPFTIQTYSMRTLKSQVPHRGSFRPLYKGIEYSSATNDTIEITKIVGTTAVECRTDVHPGNMEEEIVDHYLRSGMTECQEVEFNNYPCDGRLPG